MAAADPGPKTYPKHSSAMKNEGRRISVFDIQFRSYSQDRQSFHTVHQSGRSRTWWRIRVANKGLSTYIRRLPISRAKGRPHRNDLWIASNSLSVRSSLTHNNTQSSGDTFGEDPA